MCDYIERTYGIAPCRFRAGSPRRLYLFRADQGEPRKSYVVNDQTTARVEVLGFGNQFFAFGTHPDSGQPLQWTTSPEHIDCDDLPVLTHKQVAAILDFARPLIGATQKVHRRSDEPMPVRQSFGDKWPVGDIRDALAVIPCPADYNAWFLLSCAVFEASNGEAFEEWKSWCSAGPNYDESGVDRLWRSLFSSPSYFTAGTLVREARLNDPDWDRPSRAGFTSIKGRL
jgi:hypothetical protein